MIHAEKANFPVCRMVELLEVSRSGYYAWVDRQDAPPGPRAARRAELAVQIVDVPPGLRRGQRCPADPGGSARGRGAGVTQDGREDHG